MKTKANPLRKQGLLKKKKTKKKKGRFGPKINVELKNNKK